jgi:hypothetical protein
VKMSASLPRRVRDILTWRHWAWPTAIGALIAVSMPLQELDINPEWALWRVLYHAPWFIAFGYVFMLTIVLVEATAPGTRLSIARSVLAAIGAGLVCVALAGASAFQVRFPDQRIVEGRLDPRPAKIPWETDRLFRSMMYLGLNGALYGSLAMFIYVRLRNARLATAALADAEIRRSEEQRRLIASQLVAAQAEVDPAFVMKALDDIERAYETDPARADEALDEFIAFLRDAIPRLRSDEMEAT